MVTSLAIGLSTGGSRIANLPRSHSARLTPCPSMPHVAVFQPRAEKCLLSRRRPQFTNELFYDK